jgi:hypothetical protein
VLLSNIYAAGDNWELSAKVQQQRKERHVKKKLGCTWSEVNNEVHIFVVDDQDHPQMIEIYAELKRLFSPDESCWVCARYKIALHDVEDEEKVFHLHHRSEKLTIAFGLICTAPGTTPHLLKNLWVCGDCHTSTKFIAKIVRRTIIVRDANCFHPFKDGLCSCRDYW